MVFIARRSTFGMGLGVKVKGVRTEMGAGTSGERIRTTFMRIMRRIQKGRESVLRREGCLGMAFGDNFIT